MFNNDVVCKIDEVIFTATAEQDGVSCLRRPNGGAILTIGVVSVVMDQKLLEQVVKAVSKPK